MVDSWIFLCLAAISTLAGMAWLALAMEPHWKAVHQASSAARPVSLLRRLGCTGLLVSAVFCFMADRPSMAALVWIMLLAASAPSISMMLTWRPGLLRVFWPTGS